MQLNAGLSFRGHLRIIKTIGKSKEVIVDEDNIVLSTGKLSAATWLAEGSDYKIKRMSVGNGNLNNEVPTVDDVGLQRELKVKEVTQTTLDTSNNWVTFYSQFQSGDAAFERPVGETEESWPAEINECAIILGKDDDLGDVYFAKKNFSGQAFEHSSNITLAFVWRIWVP